MGKKPLGVGIVVVWTDVWYIVEVMVVVTSCFVKTEETCVMVDVMEGSCTSG